MKEIIARLQTEAANPKEEYLKYEHATAAAGEQQTVVLMSCNNHIAERLLLPQNSSSAKYGTFLSPFHMSRIEDWRCSQEHKTLSQCRYRGFLTSSYAVTFCKSYAYIKKKLQLKYAYLPQIKGTSENRLPRTTGQSHQAWFGSFREERTHRQPQKWNQTALGYVRVEYEGNDIIGRDGQLPVTLLSRRVGLWVLRGQDHSCRSCQDTSTGSWRQSSKGMRLCLRET